MKSSLQEVLVEELRDLFDAEKQLVRALPKMAKSAENPELQNAFREHLEMTKRQVQRIEQVFGILDEKARSKPCKGMKGLVEEGQEIIEEHEGSMRDAAIVGAARKVEHYEMAGYESARSIAQQLGFREAADLLQETLKEEMETDRLLARLSMNMMKQLARGGEMKEQPQEPSGRSRGSRRESGQRRQQSRGQSQSRSQGGRRGGAAGVLTDHEEIRRWAEERGAQPACVRGTGGRGDTGMIRLDFPGYSGEQSLEHIGWDEWFEKFDQSNLALLTQERTSRGELSNFNKLVSRETAEGRGRGKPKARAAR